MGRLEMTLSIQPSCEPTFHERASLARLPQVPYGSATLTFLWDPGRTQEASILTVASVSPSRSKISSSSRLMAGNLVD